MLIIDLPGAKNATKESGAAEQGGQTMNSEGPTERWRQRH
jgi:hypothetical protein